MVSYETALYLALRSILFNQMANEPSAHYSRTITNILQYASLAHATQRKMGECTSNQDNPAWVMRGYDAGQEIL